MFYICAHCHRAYYRHARTQKIRPFIYCPGCGCRKARKATQTESLIVSQLMPR